jgi:hypothetical protein
MQIDAEAVHVTPYKLHSVAGALLMLCCCSAAAAYNVIVSSYKGRPMSAAATAGKLPL